MDDGEAQLLDPADEHRGCGHVRAAVSSAVAPMVPGAARRFWPDSPEGGRHGCEIFRSRGD
jgi:hypothetical protein